MAVPEGAPVPERGAAGDGFLEAAASIGAQLCRDALWDGERCNWLGGAVEPIGGAWVPVQRTYGPEIYSGTSGIAYFLSRLYRLTGERIVRVTAEGAARQALSRRLTVEPPFRISFYSGLSGVAYAFLELGEACESDEWLDAARTVVGELLEVDVDDQGLDVLAGCAGAVAPLLAIHRRLEDARIPGLVERLGERLLASARKREIGWSWSTLSGLGEHQKDDLTGFSHGAGGIAWALAEIYCWSGDERYLEAARGGFAYERHWYSPEQQNWPDLRDFPDASGARPEGPVYPLQWCHGAPGIALSRLRGYEILQDEACRQEAEAAVRTTAGDLDRFPRNNQPNFSLCHGVAGNSETLIYGSRILGDPELRSLAERIGRQGIEYYARNDVPWPSGNMGQIESPNLLLGSAGTGHYYLRLHDPERTPPVLIVLPE